MAASRKAQGLAASLLVATAAGVVVHSPDHAACLDADGTSAFARFVEDHGRAYEPGSHEYQLRYALFQESARAVLAQNSRSGRSWTAGVTPLADRSEEELSRLRGYRHGARPGGGGGGAHARASALGLLSTAVEPVDVSALPKDFNYMHLNAMKDVLDQGGCGSCWAVSSATVLRAHAELYQTDRTFSAQQIVSCTPNPKHCGGKGGCGGATAELAMDYIAQAGAATADDMVYAATDSECPAHLQIQKQSLRGAGAVALPQLSRRGGGGTAFGMTGWRKLPENEADPLMLALYEQGPVVVPVAASNPWNVYRAGILDTAPKEAVLNHAVALVGYGEDAGSRYWTIQNSWGALWGESGFGRLPRLASTDENKYCGWDPSPADGTACDGGPSKVWVCGSFGILYDSVVPQFQLDKKGLLYRSGKRNLTEAF